MKVLNNLGFLHKPIVLRLGILVTIIGLVIFRQPLLLVYPRFWCEEGTYIFPYAYSHPWWQSIFYTVPYAGYHTLLHNLAAIVAAMLPLEWAPYATTYIAFLFMIVPCAIVIFGNTPLWDTISKKLVICLSIVLLPMERVWLNTTYIHFTLAIVAFLILLEDPDQLSLLKKNLYRLLLVISGLTGTVACFLTPAYFLKAFWARTRESYIQASILAISALIHLPIFFSVFISSHGPRLQTRLANSSLAGLKNILFFQFDVPFLGHRLFESAGAKTLNEWFMFATMRRFGISALYLPSLTEIIITTCVLSYLLYLIIKHLRNRMTRLVVFSFFLVFLLSALLSVNMAGGPRYAYAPAVILVTLVLAEFLPDVRSMSRRVIATAFLMLMLGINLLEYRDAMDFYSYRWPVWREEVSKWRMDSSYPLQIWPQDRNEKWHMNLQPRK